MIEVGKRVEVRQDLLGLFSSELWPWIEKGGIVNFYNGLYNSVVFKNEELQPEERSFLLLDGELVIIDEPIFKNGDRVICVKNLCEYPAGDLLVGSRGKVVVDGGELASSFAPEPKADVGVTFDGGDDPFVFNRCLNEELVFEGEKIRTFRGYRTGDISATHTPDQVTDSKQPQYYGVVFPSGKTVLNWNTSVKSIAVFDSYEAFEKIHGHLQEEEYGTFISWDN